MSVATIQQDGQWEVDIDVPENMVRQFNLGQSAALSWYGAEQTYSAKVAEIAPKKHLIKQTYPVTLAIDSISKNLFNGKAVTVTTSFQPNQSSHCFPYSAILGEKRPYTSTWCEMLSYTVSPLTCNPSILIKLVFPAISNKVTMSLSAELTISNQAITRQT